MWLRAFTSEFHLPLLGAVCYRTAQLSLRSLPRISKMGLMCRRHRSSMHSIYHSSKHVEGTCQILAGCNSDYFDDTCGIVRTLRLQQLKNYQEVTPEPTPMAAFLVFCFFGLVWFMCACVYVYVSSRECGAHRSPKTSDPIELGFRVTVSCLT